MPHLNHPPPDFQLDSAPQPADAEPQRLERRLIFLPLMHEVYDRQSARYFPLDTDVYEIVSAYIAELEGLLNVV